MCQFNLLIIDKESKNDELKKLLLTNGFGFRELNNKSLKNQIGENIKIIVTTKGDCDCGSVIGVNRQEAVSKIDIEKEQKKLRKKKWSESKIERYLADKLKKQSNRVEAKESDNESEENNWIRISNSLKNQTDPFGILFHQFSGAIEEEIIDIEESNQIPLSLLAEGELRNFRENQLYWIT